MSTAFFDYELPAHLIAQQPAEPRDHSRLLVIDRASQRLEHRRFFELPEILSPGDLLVLNDTRVLHARLLGRRMRTGGRWEGLFLRQAPTGEWELLCQTRGRLQEGETIQVEPGPLRLTLLRKTPERHWLARPEGGDDLSSAPALLERFGHVPLPPYVRKGTATEADHERYQTVFAKQPGAVAAPTAGLHFTPQLFERLAERGIGWTFVTLHVGLGTFRPIQVDDYRQHPMHAEWGELSPAAEATLTACRKRGGRIVAVGTTAVRVLETAAGDSFRPWSGETKLFIYPPYRFRTVDALITNFHLPRTTLLLLVSALGGAELVRRAYESAIEQQYRFYSYGDAMLIL